MGVRRLGIMELKHVGLIVNPVAGLGVAHNLATARRVLALLRPDQVTTGPGELGATAVANPQIISMPSITGRAATQYLAGEMAAAAVDALIVIGGDGTLADVALALHGNGRSTPILGIGAGSTNVGDLITCRVDNLAALSDAAFTVENVNALVAGCNGQELALAFNDVVIGTTILGTVDGRVVDLDATAFMVGARVNGHPQPIGTKATCVSKTTGTKSIEVARGTAVGTLIAGFAHHECFFGKAIVGGVCLTSLVGLPAGVLVCSQPIVRTQLDAADLLAAEPIRTAYVSLDAADTLTITGVDAPGVLCADGNPLMALRPNDQAFIQVLPNVSRVLRLQSP